MSYTSQLFKVKDPFDVKNTNELFLNAVRENCRYHFRRCAEYRQMLESRRFSPEDLISYKDIEKIPPIPTLFFKKHKIYSMPKRRHLITATSSGTSGKFSEIGFDTGGLMCGFNMVLKIFKWRDIISSKPTNYIILGYRPHKGNKTAVTKTAFGFTFFAPAIRRTYALKFRDGKYYPDLDGVIKAIEKYGKSRFPARFIGFPSYMYFVLKIMNERGLSVKLPENSKIMLGGGWKQFYKEQTDKETLYELAEKILGIPEENITESFGAAEHPVLYCDCKNHHFHIPAYSRVIIRDVHTLKPVKNGEVGIVNLITPMVKATPILSVMTDDLGVLHDGAECGCGINSPYLEIIGRIGLRDIKTCAAGASELISGLEGIE